MDDADDEAGKIDTIGKIGSIGIFAPPTYSCPAHGVTDQAIDVSIPGYPHNGSYCLKCWVESFARTGVKKLIPIVASNLQ